MNEEEELKNILNSKLSQEEVPFDEENWEQAEKLIDDSRKKKKRRKWFVIFFIGLGAGIAIMLPFALKNIKNSVENDIKNTQPQEEIKDSAKQVSIQQPSPIENTNTAANNTSSVNTSANETSKESADKTISKDTAKIISKERTGITKSSSPTPLATTTTKNNVKPKKTISQPMNEKGDNASTIKSNSKAETVANLSAKKEKHTITPTVEKKEVKSEKIVENKTDETANTTVSTNKPEVIRPTENSVQSSAKTDTVQKQNEPAETKVATDSTQKSDAVTAVKQGAAQTTPPAKVDSVKKTNDSTAIVKKDSALKKVDTIQTTTQPAKGPKKDFVSVEAGTNFIFGWNSGGATEARGFNPIIGIGYTHHFGNTWSMHTAVYFNTIGYLTSSTYTDHHLDYNFGFSTQDTSITTNWLYYITVPLQVQYALNAKSFIAIGGSVSYLITSSGTITTYTQTSFTTTNKQTAAQMGYYNGFSTLNASVMALYGRKLTNKLSASLSAYFGLIDIKSNSVFSEQAFERETGIRLLLSYDIF
jgi:hypothetical protein